MQKINWRVLGLLNVLLLIYSTSGIFSKLASGEKFLSFKFCLYYGMIILILGIYAVGWQQIIKRLPLTLAFANKAITIVWGLIWGVLFFGENVTIGKMAGILLVVSGVILYVRTEE